jgi:hypothetical protein
MSKTLKFLTGSHVRFYPKQTEKQETENLQVQLFAVGTAKADGVARHDFPQRFGNASGLAEAEFDVVLPSGTGTDIEYGLTVSEYAVHSELSHLKSEAFLMRFILESGFSPISRQPYAA